MRFSITIPTYNRINSLRLCLAAATSQDYDDYEVIVVDDCSADGTGEMIQQEFPKINYIRQEANRGPAAARNAGIHAATGEIIAFTDDDCLPPLDWLSRLADGYTRYPSALGVGGYQEPPAHVLDENLLARYERYIAHHIYHVSDSAYVGGFECPAGGTNNMSYRRFVLVQIGGFDETFPYAAGEDADLKWRICNRGSQLVYIPVKVTHLQSYSWASFKQQAYIRGKGRARFEAKYGHRANHLYVCLRLVRRTLNLPLDLLNTKCRPYAIIRLVEAWFNAHGEWDMIKDMHAWTSLT